MTNCASKKILMPFVEAKDETYLMAGSGTNIKVFQAPEKSSRRFIKLL